MTPLCASFALPLGPQSAALARRATREVLRRWDTADDDRLDDALLVVSELVGNAVRHGGSRVLLTVAHEPLLLTVGVEDGSAVLPGRREDHAGAESGRGMRIVEALSRRWGVTELDPGKRVWAELDWPDLAG